MRLVLGLSQDEFRVAWGAKRRAGGLGLKAFQADPDAFVRDLMELGVADALRSLVRGPTTWRDLLLERFAAGRGRAIKGQTRGRALEDLVEAVVRAVFGASRYDVRCRFVGRDGLSEEKADFAIPSKGDPCVLIETKAYGATGSKQTDVIGDMQRIVKEKRHDTTLLLVTDGLTWLSRASDLRKLVKMQNEGFIARIYTVAMRADFEDDLRQLKVSYGL